MSEDSAEFRYCRRHSGAGRRDTSGETKNTASGDFGTNIQAGNIDTVNVNCAADHDKDDESEKAETRTAQSTMLGWVCAVVIVIGMILFVIAAVLNANASSTPSYLAESGHRPRGGTNASVIAAVDKSLRLCAQAVVLTPVNCPQSVDDTGADAGTVAWAVQGDPGDGAEVYYHQDRFYVTGVAIMTVTYDAAGRATFLAPEVPYLAQVTWSRGVPTVTSLQAFQDDPPRPIEKHDPAVPWSVIAPLLRTAFNQCMAAKTAPLPPRCPQDLNAQADNTVNWSLVGNPIINTNQTFDSATGLIHVVGSYAATGSYTESFFGYHTSVQLSGTYDATFVVDDGKPVFVQIAADSS